MTKQNRIALALALGVSAGGFVSGGAVGQIPSLPTSAPPSGLAAEIDILNAQIQQENELLREELEQFLAENRDSRAANSVAEERVRRIVEVRGAVIRQLEERLDTALAGNTATIAGLVTNSRTGEPIRAVGVAVDGRPNGVLTDERGRFEAAVLAGRHVLTLSRIGYTPVTLPARQVEAGANAEIAVRLDEAVVPLRDLVGPTGLIDPVAGSRSPVTVQGVQAAPPPPQPVGVVEADTICGAVACVVGAPVSVGQIEREPLAPATSGTVGNTQGVVLADSVALADARSGTGANVQGQVAGLVLGPGGSTQVYTTRTWVPLSEAIRRPAVSLGQRFVAGVALAPITPTLGPYFSVDSGVLVTEVTEQGPGADAGLEPGDVILEVSGNPVGNVEDVRRRFTDLPTDAAAWRTGVPLRVVRRGETIELYVPR